MTKAITLWQPWASLVAEGIKTIETRGRAHPWRSAIGQRIAIHAAARRPEVADVLRLSDPDGLRFLWGEARWHMQRQEPRLLIQPLPLGAVLATALLVDVVPIRDKWDPAIGEDGVYGMADGRAVIVRGDDASYRSDQVPFGDFTPGRTALIFDNIVKLSEPCPARGHQGLWTFDAGSDLAAHEILGA